MVSINKTVVMSGADYYTDKDAINALMDNVESVDQKKAIKEHGQIEAALKKAGIKVIKVKPPVDCQDGVYIANWALVRNGKAVMSRLPNKRKPEEAHAMKVLSKLGLKILELPKNIEAFSGQGDCIVCGDTAFFQYTYRTSKEAQPIVKKMLGIKKVIPLKTKPARWFKFGPAKINKITGWPDSPTYDIDLALALIKGPTAKSKGLIAYCPGVFTAKSRRILASLKDVDKIIVSRHDALKVFALNLVSTGETVIMNSGAPDFKAKLEAHGLKTIELDLPELRKGGGSVRCSSLTISA